MRTSPASSERVTPGGSPWPAPARSAQSTETHTGGEGPFQALANGTEAILNTVADLGHQAGNIIYDFAHPIAEGAGTFIHDVFASVDQLLPVHSDSAHR